jgi:hypothetical protein
MRPDEPHDIDRALKALPAPRAPRTLLPRVMSAVDSRVARPAARPWLDWPLSAQVASAAFVLICAMGIVQLWPAAQAAAIRFVTPVVASVTTQIDAVVDRTTVAVTLTRAIWRLLGGPLSSYALVLMLVMGAACATFGAALNRVALGGHT